MKSLHSLLFSLLIFISACQGPSVPTSVAVTSSSPDKAAAEAPIYTYEVVNTYPHDRTSFTQGLVFDNGIFYESAGLNAAHGGHSSLRKVELATGKVLKKIDVPEPYFAEGLALFGGKLFQLTWEDEKGFIYDAETFAAKGEFKYRGEGWGLTHDGKSLILSDGSHQLRFLDPETFQEQRRISIYDNNRRVEKLNELEYVKGEIFANIWQEDRIVRIDPKDGNILGWIDMRDLLKPEDENADTDVLNGIAYDAAQDRLFVTGKKWPKLFEIRLKKK
ncbi:MAG: glutaminyl-peptide cyclotransferase [Acidobacteria bacterium]|nr:glutaminyl-peptide cyclotransferase [Acidobacteriota bacterium]